MLDNCVKKVLITQEQIIKRCEELGKELTEMYVNDSHEVVLVGILKGSLPFMAELIKHIDLPIKIDFMAVSSYSGTDSTGELKIIKDLDASIIDKDILIVEDIIDTGLTAKGLKHLLALKGAHDVKFVSLLDKPSRREYPIEADLVGFTIENEFVIGYGLDYDGLYRNLPYIGVIKEELC